jgi:hypothetical protein
MLAHQFIEQHRKQRRLLAALSSAVSHRLALQ